MAWNQLLSFAACVQDTQTYRITSAGELEDAVDGMLRALAPTLALYLDAIERGPGPIQLRAAYHVGMAYVSMITRARASIVAPPSFKDEAAATHFHAVHRQLESMLAPVLKATRLTFAVIVAAAEADPALASDEISKNMVKHARGMLGLLPAEPEEEDRVQWTGL